MTHAIVLVEAERTSMATLGPELAEIEGVGGVYSVTGEWDFVAVVHVKRHEDLRDVVTAGIGGHFTMDRHDAVEAARLIGAKTVLPAHYDTFPPVATDVGAFKSDVEGATDATVVVLQPGETHEA